MLVLVYEHELVHNELSVKMRCNQCVIISAIVLCDLFKLSALMKPKLFIFKEAIDHGTNIIIENIFYLTGSWLMVMHWWQVLIAWQTHRWLKLFTKTIEENKISNFVLSSIRVQTKMELQFKGHSRQPMVEGICWSNVRHQRWQQRLKQERQRISGKRTKLIEFYW